jgi:hypothetical protein
MSIAKIMTTAERGCFKVEMYNMSLKNSGCDDGDDEDEWFYDSIKR